MYCTFPEVWREIIDWKGQVRNTRICGTAGHNLHRPKHQCLPAREVATPVTSKTKVWYRQVES